MIHPNPGVRDHGPPGTERLLAGLTPEQAQAVTFGSGPLLLLAGPGAGKTRTLTHRAAYLLASGRAQPWEILAVTFSVRAALELRLRLADLLGETVARAVMAATFHSVCARLLREHASVFGRTERYTIYDQADMRRVVDWLLSDAERGDIQRALADYGQPASAEVLAEISRAKNALLSPDAYERSTSHPGAPLIAAVWRASETELRRCNAFEFDDLLAFAVRLLSEHPQRWRGCGSGGVGSWRTSSRTPATRSGRPAVPPGSSPRPGCCTPPAHWPPEASDTSPPGRRAGSRSQGARARARTRARQSTQLQEIHMPNNQTNVSPPARTQAEAAALFRRPFAPGTIGFRAMTKVPYNGQPYAGAQVAAYVGAQSVIQRLNAVVPGRWRQQFQTPPAEFIPAGTRRVYLACRLTVTLPVEEGGPDVDAVYEDLGEIDQGSLAGLKALYSDARKRAAVAAGIGAYLYTSLEAVVLPIGPHARHVQAIRRQGKSDLLVLSPETEQWLRHGYQTRMSTDAVRRDLGEILAHGEPENGIGQGEVADQAAQPAPEPPVAEPAAQRVTGTARS